MSTIPSVEYLTWLQQNDLANPPPSTATRAAARRQRLEQLDHQIERASRAASAADDNVSRRRYENRLNRLEAERDFIEEELSELDDLALDWAYRCASCAAPTPRGDYGAARCPSCRGGRA